MHARIDHLLSYRDAEPLEAHVAEHIAQCDECSARLQQLSETRAQLRALPSIDPPADAWREIEARLSRPARTRAPVRIAAAAALALVCVVLAISLRENPTPSLAERDAALPSTPTRGDAVMPAQLADLMEESRHLEQLLQALPQRPRIERVSTAATLDTLEARIQWLDLQLSYGSDTALSEEQARRLWRERVDLMDSLVKVRYAHAGQTSF